MNAPRSANHVKNISVRTHVLSGLAAEVAFAALPLLVVLMVVVHANRSQHLFSSPEWSFGAAILFGQSLVKFVSGVARGGEAATGPVALLVALLVVFGLVPSLIVLDMTLQAAEEASEPARWLQLSQVAFFLLAAVMYMLLGTVGETWTKR
jgi:hypothetical protein